jgi:2-phosphosulfolactate phosphatase
MNIKITRNIEGAKNAKGLVVIVDIFRAFTTSYLILGNNAKHIMTYDKEEDAFDKRRKIPNCVIVGEQMGYKIEGCDYNNSPAEVENVDFTDKCVLLKTSRGTKGLLSINKENVQEVLAGSFLGFSAIVNHIKNLSPKKVTIVCMGDPGDKKAFEDEIFALSLKDALEGKEVHKSALYKSIRESPTSRRFFDSEISHSSERDFDLCMGFDMFNFIIRYDVNKKRLQSVCPGEIN